MIYPNNFEQKTGFDQIRKILCSYCMSTMGYDMVKRMEFTDKYEEILTYMEQTKEFRRLTEENDDFPLDNFYDMREQISQLRLEGTFLEEEQLWDLKRSLETIHNIIRFLNRDCEETTNGEYTYKYPTLQKLTEEIRIFPNITRRISQVLNEYGQIKDSATPELARIRQELARLQGSISKTLNSILRRAQQEGHVERDVTPTMRDGRLVIPVAPAFKRKISGIVHDESASGKTVFVEPQEVVEANNHIRELEADERREIIRILKEIASMIHPFVREIADSYSLLANIDFIRAKCLFAKRLQAIEPTIEAYPLVDWVQARHPLLQITLEQQASSAVPEDSHAEEKHIIPLDIMLSEEKRMLIISGPNAGGKSVCLKTVGLLQYMLQCGLPIPVKENSKTGIFSNIMIDIGDEQSLSDDLSTYSSHLINMKQMLRGASAQTLILIDEFGTGTEPRIGGAIAESVLSRLCDNGTWGVVTTHYQNLKEFADKHDNVNNGAMLYDRHEMKPLFQLAIGRPGSSFAIEIARKIGLPEDVIQQATDIVGQDYIQSDKYLQDIVRDKRYWEGKRQNIHQREKAIEKTISHYESELEQINKERRLILSKAKEEAQSLLDESRRRIEHAIKEIRESQAEKEETKRIREELKAFEAEVSDIDVKAHDELIEKKIRQIQQRQQRKEERKRKRENEKQQQNSTPAILHTTPAEKKPINVGDNVRIKGTKTVGSVESIEKKMAVVIFGDMRTKIKIERLEHAETSRSLNINNSANDNNTQSVENSQNENVQRGGLSSIAAALMARQQQISKMTRSTIDDRQRGFKHDLDVRGMRGDEALSAVQYFIDDAILVGVQQVRILHGKGNGILRQLIRQYLASVPNVISYRDEDIRFGGTGITVAEF